MTVTLADLKAHLNLTDGTDDALLTNKLAAANAWVLDFTGYTVDATHPISEPLNEAVRMLAASLYENREAVTTDGTAPRELPFGLSELMAPYRQWVF